jgi:hypothetical protein
MMIRYHTCRVDEEIVLCLDRVINCDDATVWKLTRQSCEPVNLGLVGLNMYATWITEFLDFFHRLVFKQKHNVSKTGSVFVLRDKERGHLQDDTISVSRDNGHK